MKRQAPPQFWHSDDGNYTVVFGRRVLHKMIKLATRYYPNEIGTSLIGSYSDNGFRADVLGLAPVTKDSVSRRTWFFRGIQGLEEFYERTTRRFRGHRCYVGEWHSHPDGSPTSSETDRRSHAEIALDINTACPEAIMTVLGGNATSEIRMAVFIYSRKRGIVSLHSKCLDHH